MAYLSLGRFAIIAHRGGSLEAPENTLQAFENAFRLYPEIYFELDVQQTKDGEIVVMHDDTIDRTTTGHGSVCDHNLKELPKTIPLLSAVLEKFPKTPITIELKHGPKFFGDRVVEIIKKYKAEARVCLAGENHNDLTETSRLSPDLCSGYSKRELLLNFIWNRFHIPFLGPNRGQVMQIPYTHKGYLIASRSYVERAHRRNKFVHVWTVNDEVTMRHLIGIGVDGIITDAPTLLLKVARELKKI
jgi:glycerophosphoryl diester phosphodiesterase